MSIARGQALRLALVLEMLWWCGGDGIAARPSQISAGAFSAAARLIEHFFLPMAERVYGDVDRRGVQRRHPGALDDDCAAHRTPRSRCAKAGSAPHRLPSTHGSGRRHHEAIHLQA